MVPTGSIATLLGGHLVVLNSAAGSPKLDLAQSLDFSAVRDSFDFLTRMKVRRRDALTLDGPLVAQRSRCRAGSCRCGGWPEGVRFVPRAGRKQAASMPRRP